MKILAETTGEFMLSDLGTGDVIYAGRPSVVELSPFIEARVAISQVRKEADLTADATDDEFATYWTESEGNRDLAVESFLSKFGVDKPVAPKKGK
ncbi:hypothetical protein ACCS91_33405 [Rhizobium ruizarguesonis]